MTKPYVLVLYYSHTGSTMKLAQHVARGVDGVSGTQARLRTVPKVSTTSEAVDATVPDEGAPYVTLEDLSGCSGLVLGSPTRFGNMAAPMKYFWDSTSGLWMKGALAGKPAAVFSSSSSQHGGQETTLLTMMVPLFHHGMILMGLPYTEPVLSSTKTGGTPYGATHVAGPANDMPVDDDELLLAKLLGTRVAEVATKLSVEDELCG